MDQAFNSIVASFAEAIEFELLRVENHSLVTSTSGWFKNLKLQ